MNILLYGLVCFYLCQVSFAAPADELITSLPNVAASDMKSKQYSGYVQISPVKSIYYWYVESESDPSKDPVVLWLNGGPGCSSLEGLFVEMGPFRVHDFGDRVTRNPWTWNKYASIIYMDAPAGVGFSVRTDGNFNYTDQEVAADNHKAISMWFDKFPERKVNDFYVAGESYGGTYVPMLSALLVDDNNFKNNFKGMFIGNGCVDDRLAFNSVIGFNYFHGFIDEDYYQSSMKQCCPQGNCDYYTIALNESDPCSDILNDLSIRNYYTGLDPYFLYYTCHLNENDNYVGEPLPTYRNVIRQIKLKRAKADPGPLPECSHYNDSDVYLMRPDLRTALHIPDSTPEYSSCNDDIAYNYDMTVTHLVDQKENVNKVVAAGKRVMLFNGDTDSVCNNVHNSEFVKGLGLDLVKSLETWNDDSQQPSSIGLITRYQGLDYLTVRGAGHFVTSKDEKPKEGLQMFWNFINNQDYNIAIGEQPSTSTATTPTIATTTSHSNNVFIATTFVVALIRAIM